MERTCYKLIALDLDGTLLDSSHSITARAHRAIERILESGRLAVFATGRCRAETEEYLALFPGMRYLICENGACVLDLFQDRAICTRPIDPQTGEQVIRAVEREEVLAAFFIGNRPFMDRKAMERLEEFGLESYREVFERNVVRVEELYAFYRDKPLQAEKINLYFRSRTEGERIRERIEGLPLTFSSSIAGNLEINAAGVNKGSGLKALCDWLDIPLGQVIAVGDNSNDCQMLEMAGLPVVMGNAVPGLRPLGRVMAPDCDHDGAAVIMERYML